MIQDGIETIRRHQDIAQLDSLKAWLSPTNVFAQQSDIIHRRHEGTGQWFLNTPEFSKWLLPTNTGETLFCTGIPGAGKTMIAAIVIDHLTTEIRNSTTGVAWVYCSYRSRGEQTPSTLLGSILKQLVQFETPSVVELVTKLKQHHVDRGTKPTADDLRQVLLSVLAEFSTTYIVVDALDEFSIDSGSRSQFLGHLRALQQSTDLRLMIISRHIPDIVEEFRQDPNVEIRAHDEDIRSFITGQLFRLPRCIQRDTELQGMVQEKIASAIDGMYVHVFIW
jgi:Cdc6-like AAA superfamily ATPase